MHLVRRGEAVDAEAADGAPVAEKRCGGGRSRGAWPCGNKQESGHNMKQDEQDKEGRWTDREYLGDCEDGVHGRSTWQPPGSCNQVLSICMELTSPPQCAHISSPATYPSRARPHQHERKHQHGIVTVVV